MILGLHHLKVTLSKTALNSANAWSVNQWKTHRSEYVVEVLHVLPLVICFTAYVSTSTNRSDLFSDDPEFNLANYRKAAYRQYVMYQHGYLRIANQKVVLSCVVWRIRDKFPAPDNVYLEY